MSFYNYIFATALIFTFLHKCATDGNPELVFPEGGLETPSPYSVGLIFYVKINNTSDNNGYDVEITPDQCCLEEDDAENCDYLQILGGCSDYIPKGEIKTLKVIAPILDQYDRKGYCAIYVDSKAYNGPNTRDTIKINFDTTYQKYKSIFLDNFKHCKYRDEDPFNNCKPVDCDTYYNGKKPYYSRMFKRCVEVPPCVSDKDFDYPSIIYNPTTNQCFEPSIDENDIRDIKNVDKNKKSIRKPKDVLIIENFHPNSAVNVSSDVLIDGIVPTTLSVQKKNTKKVKVAAFNSTPSEIQKNNTNCLKFFLKKYFINNKWALIVLALVITLQCFLICSMMYCLSKSCTCPKDKKVIRKYFNYRQDVSVTTPLIGTSNMETETTDYQYLTESTNNVNQKIKCYKACQKEKNNNMKMSMSDDILSKCLNRRDWRKYKSEAMTEPDNTGTVKTTSDNTKINISNIEETTIPIETKVIFEDEIENVDVKKSKVVNIVSDAEVLNETKEKLNAEANFSSEKEIKCHSYNRFDADITGFRANLMRNVGMLKFGKSKKGTVSNSTEKGAQAYFSNDSIDDFISERGMMYVAGENISKYNFSSDSNDIKPSTSSVSSKTSKNFVKNVLSLLQKRSKQGPSSDPGQNKDIDIELIHMSRASVYSSTNDSDCNKTFKRKDSRTSF